MGLLNQNPIVLICRNQKAIRAAIAVVEPLIVSLVMKKNNNLELQTKVTTEIETPINKSKPYSNCRH